MPPEPCDEAVVADLIVLVLLEHRRELGVAIVLAQGFVVLAVGECLGLARLVRAERPHDQSRLLVAQAEAEALDGLSELRNADPIAAVPIHRIEQRTGVVQLLAKQRPLPADTAADR